MSEQSAELTKEQKIEAFLRKRAKKHKRQMMGFMFVSLVLIFWLKTTYLFIIMGILPSIIAYFIEISSFRRPFRTVFTCNIAGLLPFLVDLIHNGNSPAKMMNMMGALDTWLVIYGAAALGWLLIVTAPLVTTFFIDVARASFIQEIEQQQETLEKEWGPEVRRRESEDEDNLIL